MPQNGSDFDETIDGLAYEQDYIDEAGVTIGTDTRELLTPVRMMHRERRSRRPTISGKGRHKDS
jgi:hypothetical protein